VGIAKALELCTSGAIIRADEALRLGLANAIFPAGEALDRTLDQAKAIAAQGPLAVANVKRVIVGAADLAQERGNAFEQQAFGLQFGTEDAAEGMAAFSKKRSAKFRGV
jgi:enoyl-CoA hydratase